MWVLKQKWEQTLRQGVEGCEQASGYGIRVQAKVNELSQEKGCPWLTNEREKTFNLPFGIEFHSQQVT